ncbi:ribonuclease H-like domain-containing protein [Cladorrhinum sp. PSN332]|nr:ribonuclease H-like domain-containing protein [Cladorrhinum sp. PSN332]
MEINADNFWRELPAALETICTAEYITYDLEMTGIIGEAIQSVPERPLDGAYQMARSAAQTFQILQVGITCFSYDANHQKYKSRTYSIHLTPFFTKSSGDLARLIDRKMTFSYKTFLFLEQHGFSFEKAFARGVPYLSRAEQRKANERYLKYYHKEKEYNNPHDLNTLDTFTKVTCDGARQQIASWIESYPKSGQYVVVKYSLSRSTAQQVERSLNDVLRQLVKTEFPNCNIHFIHGGATVYVCDPRQKKRREDERKTREKAVGGQTGKLPIAFLHIFEALVGGNFAGKIDVDMLFPANHNPTVTDRIEMRKRLQRYEKKRRERPPIIVGHNQYLDLCFLYQTFVEDLPPMFAEFQFNAKVIWPQLVDTKHMAMELGFGKHLNLASLHKILSDQQGSFALEGEITESADMLCADNTKSANDSGGAAHDAGYDSWMTAIVFGNLVRKALRKGTRESKWGPSNTTKPGVPTNNPGLPIQGTAREADPFSINNNSANGVSRNAPAAASYDSVRFIPRWAEDGGEGQGKNEIWKQYGSKVRIGAAGVLDLSLS